MGFITLLLLSAGSTENINNNIITNHTKTTATPTGTIYGILLKEVQGWER